LLKELSLGLLGANLQERLLIVKDEEGGGKTLTSKLADGGYGGYTEKLSLHVLTKDAANQDSTNSQLFDLFGARLVYISEPGKNDVIISSRIKDLTSEKSKCRPLFGSNLTFNNTALLAMFTNYAPRYSEMKGIPRRVRAYEGTGFFK